MQGSLPGQMWPVPSHTCRALCEAVGDAKACKHGSAMTSSLLTSMAQIHITECYIPLSRRRASQ